MGRGYRVFFGITGIIMLLMSLLICIVTPLLGLLGVLLGSLTIFFSFFHSEDISIRLTGRVFAAILITIAILVLSFASILLLIEIKDSITFILSGIILFLLGIILFKRNRINVKTPSQINTSQISPSIYHSGSYPNLQNNTSAITSSTPFEFYSENNKSDEDHDIEGLDYHSCRITDNNLNQLRKSFIVLDTETTGYYNSDRIVSIGAVKYIGMNPVEEFYTLVNPNIHIRESASSVNRIYDEDVKDAPSESEMLKMLDSFLGNSTDIIVGYNISFDMRFLKIIASNNHYRRQIRTFDVMTLSKKKLKELKNYKQITVASHLGINTDNAHNSLADCYICAQILIKLLSI